MTVKPDQLAELLLREIVLLVLDSQATAEVQVLANCGRVGGS